MNVRNGILLSACLASFYANTAAAERCDVAIGPKRAELLVEQCKIVSQATRPPCNVANSCQMIAEEIDRNCTNSSASVGMEYPYFCKDNYYNAQLTPMCKIIPREMKGVFWAESLQQCGDGCGFMLMEVDGEAHVVEGLCGGEDNSSWPVCLVENDSLFFIPVYDQQTHVWNRKRPKELLTPQGKALIPCPKDVTDLSSSELKASLID